MSDTLQPYEGWAILELLGHRRLGGFVREATIFGAAMIRIDVPGTDESPGIGATATQYYSAAALYSLTPTTEAMARIVARGNQPQPVARWELPPASAARPARVADETPYEDDPYDDDDDPDAIEEEPALPITLQRFGDATL